MITEDLRTALFSAPDLKYRDFQAKLIPNLERDSMIGVRTPELRKMAKQFAKRPDVGDF